MKHFTIAAICGSLLFVAALQAQNPLQPVADPDFPGTSSTPLAVDPPAYRDPQPASRNAPQPLQPQTGPHDPKPAPPDELAKYPVWLLIKPDGIQFLQTLEEIATNRNTIPPHAFLLCCVTANFKAAAGEQQPEFQLTCEDFLLRGRYGSKQSLEVKGASLEFSTRTQQVQLRGSEELPLESHSLDAASETRMRAEEINLQLNGSPINETRYETMSYVDAKTGEERVIKKPVVTQIARGTSFQISAKNITSLETIASPERTSGRSADGDAPMRDPQTPKPVPDNIPFYDEPSSGDLGPTPGRKPRSTRNESF